MLTAASAPSGANLQPWFFAVVTSANIKQQIREIVEKEERINYERRMSEEWKKDLQKIGTDWQKEYLTTAPVLIVAFEQKYSYRADGTKQTHYYHELSFAIACGLLVAAIHNAGLVTLTSTPLNAGPMLRQLLGRPDSEKVQLLLPVGRPAADATVPNITRKPLDEVCAMY